MRLTCNIVRDLVGVCTDCAASDETKEAVQEHLAQCPACARYFYDYKRIGGKYRTSRPSASDSETMDYHSLSERIRRKRNTNIAAYAVAFAITLGVSVCIMGKLMKKR